MADIEPGIEPVDDAPPLPNFDDSYREPDIDPQDEHLYRDPPRGWEP